MKISVSFSNSYKINLSLFPVEYWLTPPSLCLQWTKWLQRALDVWDIPTGVLRRRGKLNLDLNLPKIDISMSKNDQKLDIFIQKNCQKLPFFSTKLPMAILLKKWQFLAIFLEKNVKFLAIFWHLNGNFPEGQIGA